MVLGHIACREKDNNEKWLITPTSIKLKDERGEMRSLYNFNKKFYIMAYQKLCQVKWYKQFLHFLASHFVQNIIIMYS